MNEAVLTGAFGLVGVLVGGMLHALAAFGSERRNAQTQARTAARLADEGLVYWKRAGDVLYRARDDPNTFESVALYTHTLKTVRRHLDLKWWEDNRAALSAAASPDEWRDISNAASAASGCLNLLDNILARPLHPEDRLTLQSAFKSKEEIHRKGSRASADESLHDDPPVGPDPETAQLLSELEEFSAEMDARAAELDAEGERLQADVSRFKKDSELKMRDDVARAIIDAQGRFVAARSACRGFAADPGRRWERRASRTRARRLRQP